MRIIHSGDWHLGKSLRGKHRGSEHEAVLQEFLDYARREPLDLLLLAGDVFDTSTPSAEAEGLFYRFLIEMRATGCAVVVIAGNHDGASRFEALTPLLAKIGVQVRHEPTTAEQGAILRIPSRDNTEIAVVACLPFPHERQVNYVDCFSRGDISPHDAYTRRVGAYLQTLGESFDPEAVNLVIAHLMMDGGRVGGGERALHLTDTYAVRPQDLPAAAQYVALGHLHRQQFLAESPVPACYSGSILQLDFGELDQQKGFMEVIAHPMEPAQTQFVRLSSGKKLRDIKGNELELEAMASRDEYADEWLRVTVQLEAPKVGLGEKIRKMFPNSLEVRVALTGFEEMKSPAESRRSHVPEELYKAYLAAKHNSVPDDSVQAFRELFEEIHKTME
jgi:DNA repair protein SbcD/Mre11